MRIVVIYKWAANPQEATVGPDGKLDWSRATATISEYDPAAIQVARTLADRLGGELIGLSLGDGAAAPMARKAALSRGLDKLYLVAEPAGFTGDATTTGLLLAAAIRMIGEVDLVVGGDASIDNGAQLVPAVVAGALGWPAIAQVATIDGTAGAFEVVRNHLGGTQRVALTGPAVVSIAPDAVTPKVPGMKEILAAGKKPSEVIGVDALDVDLPEPMTVMARSKPQLAARKQRKLDGSDPAAAAAAVVGELRAAGVL